MPLTPLPSSVRELLSLARLNWILAFDHVSSLTPQIADALCRLTSGVGVACREPGRHEPFQLYFNAPSSSPLPIAGPLLPISPPAPSPSISRPSHPAPKTSLLTVFTQASPDIPRGALRCRRHRPRPHAPNASALWTMRRRARLGHGRQPRPSPALRNTCGRPSIHRAFPSFTLWPRPSATSWSSAANGPAAPPSSWNSCSRSSGAGRPKDSPGSSEPAC